MKTMSIKTISLSLLLIVTLCTTALPNAKGDDQLIRKVCSQVYDQSSCLNILKSAPGAANANLKGLAQITINLATSSASGTLHQLQSLEAKTRDSNLKKIYYLCTRHYSSAVNSIHESEKNLRGGDYKSMNMYASAAVSAVADCADEGSSSNIDASIRAGNVKFDKIGRIILAVTNLLA